MKTRTRIDDGKGGFTETINEEQSSVNIKQSAKGQLSFEMKIYEDDPEIYKKKAFKFLDEIKAVQERAIELGLASSE